MIWENDVRLNNDSEKCRSTLWSFANSTIRLCDDSVKWLSAIFFSAKQRFGKIAFRQNDDSVKWRFGKITWPRKNFQIFKIGLKLSQISQFMEKYLKIGIFFTLRKKNSKRKTKKISKFLKLKNGLKRSWICQFVLKYIKIQICNNFERPKLQNRMKLI